MSPLVRLGHSSNMVLMSLWQPMKLGTAGAFMSVVCDCTISISVYIYLRPSRYRVKR